MHMFYVKYNLQNSFITWAVLYNIVTQTRGFFVSPFGYLKNTNMIQLKLNNKTLCSKIYKLPQNCTL